MATQENGKSDLTAHLNGPLVTVVICVYNAGVHLRPSLESVLGQTHRNLEILVVDDGSTDGCLESIRDLQDLRIRIITQENRGKPSAMNAALDQMRGEFYAVHDADDLSHPRRIEAQLLCLRDNPDVAGVYCGHQILLGDRCLAPTFRSKDREACHDDVKMFRMPAHDPTAMYRWSLVHDLRYATDLQIGEGLDYILRVGERHPLLVVGECLYGYRIHSQSLTKRDPERRELLVREALRRACVRRGLDYSQHFGQSSRKRSGARDFDNNLASNFMESVVDLRNARRYIEAFKTGLACASLQPRDPHYYKALLYALIPASLRRIVRPTERYKGQLNINAQPIKQI